LITDWPGLRYHENSLGPTRPATGPELIPFRRRVLSARPVDQSLSVRAARSSILVSIRSNCCATGATSPVLTGPRDATVRPPVGPALLPCSDGRKFPVCVHANARTCEHCGSTVLAHRWCGSGCDPGCCRMSEALCWHAVCQLDEGDSQHVRSVRPRPADRARGHPARRRRHQAVGDRSRHRPWRGAEGDPPACPFRTGVDGLIG